MPPRRLPAQSRARPGSPVNRPAAAGIAPAADGPGALDAAEAAFALLVTGPRPLALNPVRCWAGLPDRMVPLGELKALLLHPSVGPVPRNKVWAELVRRARSGNPAWTVGLVGVAMPGLRRATASLAAAYHGPTADLEGEVLTGFLAAMRALDLDDLDRVPLASRLCWAAWRAGRAAAYADATWAARRRGLPEACSRPVPPWGHPDFVLAAAARAGILTRAEAALIGRNRLEHVPSPGSPPRPASATPRCATAGPAPNARSLPRSDQGNSPTSSGLRREKQRPDPDLVTVRGGGAGCRRTADIRPVPNREGGTSRHRPRPRSYA